MKQVIRSSEDIFGMANIEVTKHHVEDNRVQIIFKNTEKLQSQLYT